MPRFKSTGTHLFIVVLVLPGYFKLQIDLLALLSLNITPETPNMHLALPVSLSCPLPHQTHNSDTSKNYQRKRGPVRMCYLPL